MTAWLSDGQPKAPLGFLLVFGQPHWVSSRSRWRNAGRLPGHQLSIKTLATSIKQWLKGEEVEKASDFCFILLLLNTFPYYSCLSFSERGKGLNSSGADRKLKQLADKDNFREEGIDDNDDEGLKAHVPHDFTQSLNFEKALNCLTHPAA
ncbi:hypothetical protein EI94DRAFT_1699555 [Lactarius quietus]|nr:hypothetical protein EI94DRAFT_1699555 [Lactarius quietus]